MNRRRAWTFRIVLAAAAVVVALAACEVALRAVGYYYMPFAIRVRHEKNEQRFVHLFDHAWFVYDPVLIWRPLPDTLMFNRQGFRGPEVTLEKPPGELRVFAVGDSNTIGWPPKGDGHNGANWPEYLGEILARRSPREVKVVNAGVYGYSSYQGVEVVRRILAYKPDIVLISFGGNDAHRVAVADADFNTTVFRSRLMTLRTAQLVKAGWDRATTARRNVTDEDLVFRVDLDHYRENLAQMVRMCRAEGCRCVLLTRPFSGQTDDACWWKHYAPDYVAATIAMAQEEGVPVVDLNESFRNRPADFADESHFTEGGHRAAAAIVAEAIQPWTAPREP